MSNFAQQIQDQLAPCFDGGRAIAMAAYMRGRFVFMGIPAPLRRQATLPLIRAFTGDPADAARSLWALPQREYQYVAVDLLRRHGNRLGAAHWSALEALVQSKSWWDSVDGLAVVIGGIVQRDPGLAVRMDNLIAARDLWLRRVALLHQLEWQGGTDRPRLFDYCLRCAGESEFFIRKAIGWALRQYARTDPAAVRTFLQQHREKLSGLSYREAAKHL